jgi:hypothetical protein
MIGSELDLYTVRLDPEADNEVFYEVLSNSKLA